MSLAVAPFLTCDATRPRPLLDTLAWLVVVTSARLAGLISLVTTMQHILMSDELVELAKFDSQTKTKPDPAPFSLSYPMRRSTFNKI